MQVQCLTATPMWFVICLSYSTLSVDRCGFGVADESSLLGCYTVSGTVYRIIQCISCVFIAAQRFVASTGMSCRPASHCIMYSDGTRCVKFLNF